MYFQTTKYNEVEQLSWAINEGGNQRETTRHGLFSVYAECLLCWKTTACSCLFKFVSQGLIWSRPRGMEFRTQDGH